MRLARSGLVSAICYGKAASWDKAAERYRQYLFGVGQEVPGGTSSGEDLKSKCGFTQKEIATVLAAGGKLTVAQVLRCRVRYFTCGVVLGSQEFVDSFFQRQRDGFGERRQSGARKMKLADWGGLRVLRDLRIGAVEVPDDG